MCAELGHDLDHLFRSQQAPPAADLSYSRTEAAWIGNASSFKAR
jgi:hypothetical protein